MMPKLVVAGAKLRCSQGMALSTLMVPQPTMQAQQKPLASVEDNQPFVNVMPFGMCRTLANPQVDAATKAAMGVLTPMPCLPVIAAPWQPGAQGAKVLQKRALTSDSTCRCNWTGEIAIVDPGTTVELTQ